MINGICDNASQVLDLYNALFTGSEYHGDPEILDSWDKLRSYDLEKHESYEHLNIRNPFVEDSAKFWHGNHVVILTPMKDLRWHKWGDYIGEFNHRCEYLSDEEGIEQVYAFDIFKVV